MEGGFYGFGFDPFVEDFGPELEVVGAELLEGLFVGGCSEFGWNVAFAVSHEAHAHA